MRGAFIKTLVELAEKDERIFLLTGDLGYWALEPFADRFPERFVNVGVAEQNMVGVATGMAESGYIPFVYSIVTFAALRPYEFIRNGPILHQLPVRIVGVGGGMEYGHNGASHWGLEDVGVMRIQPGLTVVAPADHKQTATALESTWNLPGPVFYRLGKDDRTEVPGLNGKFHLGKVQTLALGKDPLIVTMGSVSVEAVKAVEILKAQGLKPSLVVVASICPPPVEDLVTLLSEHSVAVTVEAHYEVGGIGSLVSEVTATNGLNCKVVRCAVSELPDGKTGGQAYLYNKHGLSAEAIARAATDALKEQADKLEGARV